MMRLLVAAAAVLIAAVLFLMLGTKKLEPGPADREDPAAKPSRNAPSVPSASDSEPVAGTERQEESAAPLVDDVASPDSNEESNADDVTRIHGRFVYPGGAPVVGMPIKMHGWGGNSDRVAEHGIPEDWEDPASETDSEGRFEVHFDPPRAFQFTLDAKINGYAEEGWRWGQLEPGAVLDLGEIEIRAGGRIRGRVVNKDGEPIPGFRVSAESENRDLPNHERYWRWADVDRESSEFLVVDMPSGPTTLSGRHDLGGRIYDTEVTVRAGDVVEKDLVYDGPDHSRRISVSASTRPIRTVRISADSIHLHGPGGLHKAGDSQGGRNRGSATFDNLPQGTYSIEIDDPRFFPWRKDNVALGTKVRATLKGNAAIQLTVTNETSGNRVEDYALRMEATSSRTWPNTFEIKASDEPPPDSGVIDGLPPGDYRLVVSSPDFPETPLDIAGLGPHETRPVSVSLSPAASISGVVTSSGNPVPGAKAWLLVGDAAPDRDLNGHRRPKMEVSCEEDGSFQIPDLIPGTWWLQGLLTNAVTSTRIPISIEAGESVTGVNLELPPHGVFKGQVGEWLIGMEGLEILFSRIEHETNNGDEWLDPVLWQHANVGAEVDREGFFASKAFPYGDYEAHLYMPPAQIPTSGGSWMSSGNSTTTLQAVRLDRDVVDLEVATHPLGGSLLVTVIIDGVPAAGHTAVLLSAGEDVNKDTLGAVSDEQGVAWFPAVMAGDWTLRVAPRNASWSAADDTPIRIAPGAKHRRNFAIEIHEHALRIEDSATGEALADTRISLKIDFGNSWTQSQKRTDADGNLTLRLPRGTHVLQLQEPDGNRMETSVQWGADGARPNPLRFGTSDH